jgi:tetratricopeptide (TPR) repeat protein
MSASDAGVEDLFRAAAAEMSFNNLAIADVHCREILERDRGHAGAQNLVGVIAAKLGLFDTAESHFQNALKRDGAFKSAQDNLVRLARAREQVPADAPPGERFLLIKSWGAGFWADVSHVLGAAFLAELTGRTPVVHWGRNNLFDGSANNDAFTRYFEPLSNVALEDLRRFPPSDFFPPKWTPANLAWEDNNKWDGIGARLEGIYFLNRPERIAVADFYIRIKYLLPWVPPQHPAAGQSLEKLLRRLAAQYIKPRKDILEAVAAFRKAHFGDGPVVAVHARGSDKIIEYDALDALNERYFTFLDTEDSAAKIFLLTDDERWLRRFRERYRSRLIATVSHRSENEHGVHLARLGDPAVLGKEVMIDTYLALACDKFYGNGRSNVSAMIAILKDWAPDACVLLAPSQLHEP